MAAHILIKAYNIISPAHVEDNINDIDDSASSRSINHCPPIMTPYYITIDNKIQVRNTHLITISSLYAHLTNLFSQLILHSEQPLHCWAAHSGRLTNMHVPLMVAPIEQPIQPNYLMQLRVPHPH